MELSFIRDMFEAIAPKYDLLNRLLSLGRDVHWRRLMVAGLDLGPGAKVLDVAGGTGDVAIEIFRQKGHDVTVFCTDFSPGMLRLAKSKIQHVDGFDPEKPGGIRLAAADAFHLPFPENTFDALTIAFGIRNIQDKATVLRAFWKCLKPGGQLRILELASPEKGWMTRVYLMYFRWLLPIIGGIISGNRKAYTYLPDSVMLFPRPEIFSKMIRQAGFEHVRWRKMTLGAAVLYYGKRPCEP